MDIADIFGSPDRCGAGRTFDDRKAFEIWIVQSGAFTDWSRYGDGYAKPLVERTWQAWKAACAYARC